MAYTQADLDRLKAMVDANILESSHGDKKIKFDDMDGLEKRIKYVVHQIAMQNQRKPMAGRVRFTR